MIGAVVQARMGSSRLPGKVLREVLGKPLLQYLIERLQASRRLDRVIVATTVGEEDGPIAALASRLRVPCTRGSRDDVLGRYEQAAREHGLRHIVRVCADCPLLDPAVLDRVVDRYLELLPNVDYVANIVTLTYPDGLDVEVFSLECLERLHASADKPYQREHVTAYLYEHRDRFRIQNVASEVKLSDQRWTVDNEEDFTLVRQIIEELYPAKPLFLLPDILAFLAERPQLLALNSHIRPNEGFVRSLENQGLSGEEKERIVRTVLERKL